MVTLDDLSFAQRGESFPVPRRLHARALRALARLRPRVVVYGAEFWQAGDDESEDTALLRAMRTLPRLVLPTTHVDAGGPRLLGAGRENRVQSRADFGVDVEVRDADGSIRRFDLVVERFRGLPSDVAIAARLAGANTAVGAPPSPAWLDVAHEPCNLDPQGSRAPARLDCPTPAYTLAALLGRRIPARAIRDRVVVVGYTSANLQLRRQTWAGADALATPLELKAHALGTALRGFPLRSAGWWWTALGFALCVLPPALLSGALEARRRRRAEQPRALRGVAAVVGAGLLGCLLWIGAATALFALGGRIAWIVPPVAAGVASTAVQGAMTGSRLRRRGQEVWRTATAFAPAQLVEQIVREHGGSGRLEPSEPVEMTILFADLRGSTEIVAAFDRAAKPAILTYTFLDEFQNRAIEAVTRQRGFVQSLEGDGILAVFGLDRGGPDHAGLAIRAGLALTGEVLEDFARWFEDLLDEHPAVREALGDFDGLGLRVGINTGNVAAGTAGSDARYGFVTVGRTTHNAAKLMAAGKSTADGAGETWEPWDPAIGADVHGDDALAAILSDRADGARPNMRIVVVSDATMRSARARSGDADLADVMRGFLPARVRLPGSAPVDVWVHQRGRPAATTSAGL